MKINYDNVEFKEEKSYLSNMYEIEINFFASDRIQKKFSMFKFNNKIYKSSEHLYMSLKSNNLEYQEKIRLALK